MQNITNNHRRKDGRFAEMPIQEEAQTKGIPT